MIVLDTHIWIWLVSDPEKLSPNARDALEYTSTLGICPISCWEISTKVARQRLSLDRDVFSWVKQALAWPRVTSLPLSPEIAVEAGQLDPQEFHGDPADRLIVATARHHGAELVTKDRHIRSFSKVRTIW